MAAAFVLVVAGPAEGKRLELAPGASAIIGRGREAALAIPDEHVSRRHVELRHEARGILVRDLGSRHGAVLDGRPIPSKGEVLVPLRGLLVLGSSRLRIERVPASEPRKNTLPGGLRIEARLGAGEFGEVFRAWQDPPGRRVAVKVLRSEESGAERRLEREADLQGRLDHPTIGKVFGLFRHEGRLHLVRELVDGASLAEVLKGGPLPWKRAAALAGQVALALTHAHERGVIHRDVQPGNIFVADDGIRLVDFGLACDATRRATLEKDRLTATVDQLGSTCYAAPEQYENAPRVGPAADVYGLGAVLYHALAGKPPHYGVHPYDYMRAVFAGPVPIEKVAPQVPLRMAVVVARAVAVDPRDRPTAADLARQLVKS